MRLTVKDINDKDLVVELKPQKKHRELFLDKAEEFKDAGEDFKKARAFLGFQDELVIECSNLTEEQYNDSLDLEVQGKLIVSLRDVLFPFGEKKN